MLVCEVMSGSSILRNIVWRTSTSTQNINPASLIARYVYRRLQQQQCSYYCWHLTKRVVCTGLLARSVPEWTVHCHLLPSHLQQTPGAGRDVHDGHAAAPGEGRLVRGGSAAPTGHPTEFQDGKYSIAIKFFSLRRTFYFFDSSTCTTCWRDC